MADKDLLIHSFSSLVITLKLCSKSLELTNASNVF
jgi:hypothetical protein